MAATRRDEEIGTRYFSLLKARGQGQREMFVGNSSSSMFQAIAYTSDELISTRMAIDTALWGWLPWGSGDTCRMAAPVSLGSP